MFKKQNIRSCPTIRELLVEFGLLGLTKKSVFYLLLTASFAIKNTVTLFISERNMLFLFGDATLLIKKREYFLVTQIIGMLCCLALMYAFMFASEKQLLWLGFFHVVETRPRLARAMLKPIIFEAILKKLKYCRFLLFLCFKSVPVSLWLFSSK